MCLSERDIELNIEWLKAAGFRSRRRTVEVKSLERIVDLALMKKSPVLIIIRKSLVLIFR